MVIGQKYVIKELGDLKWILNMEVTRDRKNKVMTLSQESYIRKLIKRFNMETAKPVSSPCQTIDLTHPVLVSQSPVLDKKQHELYRDEKELLAASVLLDLGPSTL